MPRQSPSSGAAPPSSGGPPHNRHPRPPTVVPQAYMGPAPPMPQLLAQATTGILNHVDVLYRQNQHDNQTRFDAMITEVREGHRGYEAIRYAFESNKEYLQRLIQQDNQEKTNELKLFMNQGLDRFMEAVSSAMNENLIKQSDMERASSSSDGRGIALERTALELMDVVRDSSARTAELLDVVRQSSAHTVEQVLHMKAGLEADTEARLFEARATALDNTAQELLNVLRQSSARTVERVMQIKGDLEEATQAKLLSPIFASQAELKRMMEGEVADRHASLTELKEMIKQLAVRLESMSAQSHHCERCRRSQSHDADHQNIAQIPRIASQDIAIPTREPRDHSGGSSRSAITNESIRWRDREEQGYIGRPSGREGIKATHTSVDEPASLASDLSCLNTSSDAEADRLGATVWDIGGGGPKGHRLIRRSRRVAMRQTSG